MEYAAFYLGEFLQFDADAFVISLLTPSFLEFFPPGMSFIVISICIRIVHAAGNAGAITSTFTYTAVEFPNSVAKIFVNTKILFKLNPVTPCFFFSELYKNHDEYCPTGWTDSWWCTLRVGRIQSAISNNGLPPDGDGVCSATLLARLRRYGTLNQIKLA